MNTKLFSVALSLLLINTVGLAAAESIHLSGRQMDSVTAGTNVEYVSQSYSGSQVALEDNGMASFRVVAFAQGDSVHANATFQPLESSGAPDIHMPFSFFSVTP